MKYIIIVTLGLLFIADGCLAALLLFWHYGKKDIKEYLYVNSNTSNQNKKR